MASKRGGSGGRPPLPCRQLPPAPHGSPKALPFFARSCFSLRASASLRSATHASSSCSLVAAAGALSSLRGGWVGRGGKVERQQGAGRGQRECSSRAVGSRAAGSSSPDALDAGEAQRPGRRVALHGGSQVGRAGGWAGEGRLWRKQRRRLPRSSGGRRPIASAGEGRGPGPRPPASPPCCGSGACPLAPAAAGRKAEQGSSGGGEDWQDWQVKQGAATCQPQVRREVRSSGSRSPRQAPPLHQAPPRHRHAASGGAPRARRSGPSPSRNGRTPRACAPSACGCRRGQGERRGQGQSAPCRPGWPAMASPPGPSPPVPQEALTGSRAAGDGSCCPPAGRSGAVRQGGRVQGQAEVKRGAGGVKAAGADVGCQPP